MVKKYVLLLMLILFVSKLSLAHQEFDVKELKETGKISSLELFLISFQSITLTGYLKLN